MNKYTLVENNQRYGLTKDGNEVLPCVYEAIWCHSDSLIGFRDGGLYGLFSVVEEKVIHPATLVGEFIFYQHGNEECSKPRFVSSYGIHTQEKIYIEQVYPMLKEYDFIPAYDGLDVLLAYDDGTIKTLAMNDDTYEYYACRLYAISFIELPNGHILVNWDSSLPFLSPQDEELYLSELPYNQEKAEFAFMKYVDQVIQERGLDKESGFQDYTIPAYIKFDYDAIPLPIIRACEKHLDKYYEVATADIDYTKSIIYLAWLYANNFVFDFGDGFDMVDHRYDFNDPDGEPGYNLNVYRDLMDLYEITPLLKISDFTGGYLSILAEVN